MYKIELGKSGLQVPTVAVGCMRISDKSEKEVSAFVDTALSNGANFFDTPIFTAAEKANPFSVRQFRLQCVTRL